MNFKVVLRSLGILLVCEAISLIPSLIVSIIYKDNDTAAFLYTMLIIFAVALPLIRINVKQKNMYSRDGFAIVALGWILMSIFGALPFYLSGAIPSFIDCFFETSSGLTTTGASILTNVELLPRGLLFWRSFTHWIGGMGVIVFTLAILPHGGAGAMQMMIAESPGPNPGKLVPKVGETAKLLYGIYAAITALEIILLVVAGMPVYDSFIHAFGTVGTGGFSNMNASVGAYKNVYIEIIITVFMFLSAVNFGLYYRLIKEGIKSFLHDEEFKFFSFVVFISILLITVDLNLNIYKGFFESVRYAAFQVVSVISTTGYATTDFNQWSMFSKAILFVLMFIGGCAGSTGGAIKNIRVLLLFKMMKRELQQIIHPKAVFSIRLANKRVEERTLLEVLGFFFMYIAVFVIGVLVVSLDNLDWGTTITSVAATLGNIGPGFGMVGAVGNFSAMSDLSKMVLSLCMIVGRLEIYPILLLMMPSFWKRVNI